MIIFDLGGVLLNESNYNLLHVLPAHVEVELINGKPPSIFYQLFDFANILYNKDCKREWMLGTLSGEEIAQRIYDEIERPEYAHLFKNVSERNLIKYGTPYIIVPEKLVQLTSLNEEGFTFVKECKQRGIRMLVLSNWDPVSFAMIKDTFKELFALFDEHDIIIPVQAGYIKPDKEIYTYIIEKAQLDPKHTFFIDDSAANVRGSELCGIQGIVHRSWQQTNETLQQKGLLL